MLEIVEYRPEHQQWFEELNREWIERHFWMEPLDAEVLQHPDKHILAKGGTILMASSDREIAGTVALKFVAPGVYEFTKMAVEKKFRGKRIGQALAEAALEKAKKMGAEKVILYSSTKLTPALALYRKLGFVEVPVDGPYKRSDVKMELELSVPEGNMRIRPALHTDVPILAQLGANTFYETFASFNRAEDMKSYIDKNFNVGQLEQEFYESGTHFLLAHHNKEVVGYAKLSVREHPAALREEHTLEIDRFYSTNAYVGKGVGKSMMKACLDIAKQNDHKVVWLGVWEHNPRAISFYEKWGFRRFGSHPFMLGQDLQTDILMKKDILM